jgi:hypothetical protein
LHNDTGGIVSVTVNIHMEVMTDGSEHLITPVRRAALYSPCFLSPVEDLKQRRFHWMSRQNCLRDLFPRHSSLLLSIGDISGLSALVWFSRLTCLQKSRVSLPHRVHRTESQSL